MYKKGQALLVSNNKSAISGINLEDNDFNSCKIKYFLYTVPAGYVCVDSYDTYKRLIVDKEPSQEEQFAISIRKYAKPAPEGYVEIEGDIYAVKDIEDNCEAFDISDHIYIDGKRYEKSDIVDNCDEIEVVVIGNKQYDIQKIQDDCDAI